MSFSDQVELLASLLDEHGAALELFAAQWVDSTLTDEQEKNVRKIERFSPEYFDLVKRHGKDVAKYLAIEGDVTIVLDGQAYSF